MASVERITLAPGYGISRVLKGGWQLAGGHGLVDARAALDDMDAFVAAGITTFDCADIYTGVEALIGRFLARRRAAESGGPAVQVHTKCVPDRDRLPGLTRADIDGGIDRSLARLGVERLDLVQLHWWDYDIPGWDNAARWLDDARRAGKVRLLGLTNFDTQHLGAILATGAAIASHQVQYSVLDRRPANGMDRLCERSGVRLLAYGALAGGFLSERWLGKRAPQPPLDNRSLVKYRLIIDECGGWEYFQALLEVMKSIADKHGVSIGTVAIRWVLDRAAVAAVIVGARHPRHLDDTLRAFDLELDEADRTRIAALQATAAGPGGDVYALERVRGGRHAAIMRDNLQQA